MNAPSENLLDDRPADEPVDSVLWEDVSNTPSRGQRTSLANHGVDTTVPPPARWKNGSAKWSVRDGIRRALIGRLFKGARSHGRYMRLSTSTRPQSHNEPLESVARLPAGNTFIQNMYNMTVSSWLNVLLVFIPIGTAAALFRMNPLLVFTCNSIAIVPLSAVLTEATEMIASEAGDTIGALLNISFGNLVELILFVIALANGHIQLVQASILGSILVNLLLILGSALMASTVSKTVDITQNSSETQLLACLLFVSVFVILMPTAFDSTFDNLSASNGLAIKMSRTSAVMVLFIYVIYLLYEIRAHSSNQVPTLGPTIDMEVGEDEPAQPSVTQPSRARSSSIIGNMPSRTIRFADQNEKAHIGGTSTKTEHPIELDILHSQIPEEGEASEPTDRTMEPHQRSGQGRFRHRRTRSHSVASSRGEYHSRESSLNGDRQSLTNFLMPHSERLALGEHTHHEPSETGRGDKLAPVAMLIITSILMSMCCEFLVSTIDDVTREGSLSHAFIGLIILPIVGNIAEYVTVVTVAMRQKLDLAISVAVGSSIQIALCVTPLTVLAGWIMSSDLALTFNYYEMATLVGTVLLVNLLILTGGSSDLRTNSLKGALMCACYIIFGLGAYLTPSTD